MREGARDLGEHGIALRSARRVGGEPYQRDDLARAFIENAGAVEAVAQEEAGRHDGMNDDQRRQHQHQHLRADAVEKPRPPDLHAGSTAGVNR